MKFTLQDSEPVGLSPPLLASSSWPRSLLWWPSQRASCPTTRL